MKSRLISLGQTASHEPVTEQLPKPASSIALTISITRRSFSTLPCGRRLRCDALAETNSIAEAFLHAATQAPQPMQEAASIADSAFALETRIVLASGAWPVATEMKTPASTIRSRGLRS